MRNARRPKETAASGDQKIVARRSGWVAGKLLLSGSIQRRSGANNYLGSSSEIEVISVIYVDRARATARADDRTNGRSLSAPGNSANDRANRRTDCRPFLSSGSLAFVANRAFGKIGRAHV